MPIEATAVNQTQTEYLPESNEYLVRYFGYDNELLCEHRIAAEEVMDGSITLSNIYSSFTEEERLAYDDLIRAMGSSNQNVRFEFDYGDFKYYDDETVFLPTLDLVSESEGVDIEAERGGALDEFLEEFKPHNTTPERSDEQE